MKKFTLFIALVIACSFSFGQNLITNGDFESPGMTVTPVPSPWGGFKNRIVRDTVLNSFLGQVENGDGSLFQEFGVTPGETYIVQFNYEWITSAAANSNLNVRIKDANNLPTNLDFVDGTTANGYMLNTTVGQWFKASFRFIPPMGVDSVRLLLFKSNGNKPLNLDSVSVSVFVPCTAPVAAFSIADTNLLELTFSNQSAGTDLAYLWTFGDGDSSMDVAPTHTYGTSGTYVVCLEATDTCGVTVSVCDTVTVTACTAPVAAFAIADTNDLAITFTNQSTGSGLSYSWTFGDGNTSTDAAPVHTYDTTGTYTVCLEVTDSCGTTISFCDDITLTGSTSIGMDFPYELSIYPNPAHDFIRLSASQRIEKIEIFNMSGQQLMVQDFNDRLVEVHINGLAQGIYILRAHIDDAIGTYKLIIE
jgi:PKD repeat protein